MQRQVFASSSLQPMSVKWISPLSSSSSLTRQQRAQPSHRLSHSLADISSKVLVRQNGGGASDRSLTANALPGRPPPRRSGVAALGAELAPLHGVPRAVSFWRRVGPLGTLGATAI